LVEIVGAKAQKGRVAGPVKREAILDLAAELFAHYGYRGTNLQLVADRLGVTRQALYYQFRSKDEILSALFDRLMSRLENAIVEAEKMSGARAFFAMVDAHLRVVLSDSSLALVLLHERPEMAKIDGLNASERRLAYTHRFAAVYRKAVAEGGVRDVDPLKVSNAVLAAANSVVWSSHSDSARVQADALALMSDLIHHGLAL
jgi:AcrR family transcriptional regulator